MHTYIYLRNSNTSYIHICIYELFFSVGMYVQTTIHMALLWWYHLQTHMDMENNTRMAISLARILPKASCSRDHQ